MNDNVTQPNYGHLCRDDDREPLYITEVGTLRKLYQHAPCEICGVRSGGEHMTTHDIWTDDITAEATKRYNDGASILTIARELQALCGREITKNMVSGKMKRLRMAGVEFTRQLQSPIIVKDGKHKRKLSKQERDERSRQRAHHRHSAAQSRIDNALAAEAYAATLEPLPDPVMLLVGLMDLTERSCRWIVGSGRDAKYCGCEIARGSYCAIHYERAGRRAPEFSDAKYRAGQRNGASIIR